MIIENNKGYYSKKVSFFDNLSREILKIISEKPMSISEIAKITGKSEQLISYYINKKLKNYLDIVNEDKKTKYKAYKSYYDIVNEKEDFIFYETKNNNLYPFIENNTLNCLIVVGSPLPHGPFSASSRDSHYVGYLTSFLGKFFNKTKYSDFIRLDTDVIKENLLNSNLILLGGPVSNYISYKINTILKVRFLQEYNWDIYSDFTNKRYSNELVSLISCLKNPFDENKRILLIAGKRALGTKIAIKYFISSSLDLSKDFYIVIDSLDLDSDGIPEKIIELEKN
ncbi:MAG: helix-turn-helix domain-containing protein [Candidatus Aenigmatarchaeota archaeon]